MTPKPPCPMHLDIKKIFPGSAELIKDNPMGYAYGFSAYDHGIGIKSWVYAIAPDPMEVPNCVLCLERFLEGSPVIVRYNKDDLKLRGSIYGLRFL